MKKENTSEESINNLPTPIKKESNLKVEAKRRKIIIETDGKNIYLVEAETTSQIELIAILESLARVLKIGK